MDVVASRHPPAAPCVEVQLSVRHGREAVRFYEAAFGAQTCFRLGGTDGLPEVVAQLQVGPTGVLGGGRVA
jgi:predicted enzyme related to lactoylglutathione lyase